MRTTPDNDGRLVVRRQFLHLRPEHLEVLKATRAVRVHHQEPPAPRVQHPVPHRTALPQVRLQLDDADVAVDVVLGQRQSELRGVV